jgi:hypothetical protein
MSFVLAFIFFSCLGLVANFIFEYVHKIVFSYPVYDSSMMRRKAMKSNRARKIWVLLWAAYYIICTAGFIFAPQNMVDIYLFIEGYVLWTK